jgi:hypothetical protein
MNIARTRWLVLVAIVAAMTGCVSETDQGQSSAPQGNENAAQFADGEDSKSDGLGVAPTTAASLVELPPVREIAEDISIADPSTYRAIEELSLEMQERTLREETTIERSSGRIETLPRIAQESK